MKLVDQEIIVFISLNGELYRSYILIYFSNIRLPALIYLWRKSIFSSFDFLSPTTPTSELTKIANFDDNFLAFSCRRDRFGSVNIIRRLLFFSVEVLLIIIIKLFFNFHFSEYWEPLQLSLQAQNAKWSIHRTFYFKHILYRNSGAELVFELKMIVVAIVVIITVSTNISLPINSTYISVVELLSIGADWRGLILSTFQLVPRLFTLFALSFWLNH